MTKAISVFFPCINEEGNIENTVDTAEEVLKKLNLTYEIIIVDDGSTDKTGEIADKLASKNSKVKVIHHPRNLGYGEALKSGFYNASYDTIVYTDGDRQFDFSEVTKLLEKIKDHDLVIGYRIKRQDSFIRKLFGRGWRLTLLVFFGIRLKDVDCGFKMIRRSVLEKIPHLESQRGAMINAELAIKARKYDLKVGQVGVNHYPRISGKPTGANIKVIFKSYIDLLRLWWKLKDNKAKFLAILAIIVLASFLRFYKLDEYMTFLGDEGRDAIVIKKMLVEHHFPRIGPPTSVGNVYLGPLYYYMMAIPMSIFWLNPVAAAGMNALIGVFTVALIYYLGKIWFGKDAGLIAAYLYAISPVTIIYSRSSWNPNPAPFFVLLAIWGFYKARKSSNFLWLILSGATIAAASQMHYLALILIPISLILWSVNVLLIKKEKTPSKYILLGTLGAVLAFLAVISPLIWFDFEHNLLNYRAIIELMSADSAIKSDILANISRAPYIFFYNLVGRYITGENYYLTIIISLLVILALVKNWATWPKITLGIWLIMGIVGLTFYQQSIYDHYLGFLNPVPFLLFGSVALYGKNFPIKLRWLFNTGLLILLLFLTIVNVSNNPLRKGPNNQLKRTQQVAKYIIAKLDNKDFNFALIAERNYDAAYQFYLDVYGHKAKQVPLDITEQLFVVCEDTVCDPTHNAKYELAAFGWSKIEWMQEFNGVKIYKLVHNPSGKP